jgi:GDP-mannose transporter
VYTWAKVRQSQSAKNILPTTQPMSASSLSNRDAANS